MTEVAFYQLAAKPLDAVLPRLLAKAVAGGHRVVVRATDAALLARLDTALWTYDAASFVPHAIDGDDAAAQAVLLTTGDGAANNPDVVAVIDGALPGDLAAYARALYLFDGGDTDALALARRHWKALAARDDVTPVYWREDDDGHWVRAG